MSKIVEISSNEIEKCSCDESLHLRAALKAILEESAVDGANSLERISHLAFQALRLKSLD